MKTIVDTTAITTTTLHLQIETVQPTLLMSKIVNNKINEISSQELVIFINTKKLYFLGKGSFGTTYLHKNGTVIKCSHILEKINEHILKNMNDSSMNYIANYMSEFNNELIQIQEFSKLKKLFPKNIIHVYYTHRALVNNNMFIANVACMEYIDGINANIYLDKLVKINTSNSLDAIFDFIKKCLKVIIQFNLLGYFHNDINLTNIMVKDSSTELMPIFIDYSFGKKLNELSIFPIECSMFVFQIKQYFEKNKYAANININNFLLFADVMSVINEKYNIYETIFIEKIITGSGVFALKDYTHLPKITQEDINKINFAINNFCIRHNGDQI